MDSSADAAPRDVHAYHCLCSHLLFASTKPLSALEHRAGLDKSYILPLPPPPRSFHGDAEQQLSHYALLPGVTRDRNPMVIRSAEGFEKRYVHRCGRCRLVVGYQLDRSQYQGEDDEDGIREDVMYLLPGGLLESDDMLAGKDMSANIGFEGVSTAAT
jgi:hypothetical protein